jgi:hypothetical protein
MNLVRLILLGLLIAVPSLASAETISFEDATTMLGASCGNDIDANCRGVNLDASRLKDCLGRNQDSVSNQCKADYVRAFDAIQKRVVARAAVSKICQREALKLCANAEKDAGKVLECLMTTRGISPKCSQAIGDAGYR